MMWLKMIRFLPEGARKDILSNIDNSVEFAWMLSGMSPDQKEAIFRYIDKLKKENGLLS
jgi:hypothetical protein